MAGLLPCYGRARRRLRPSAHPHSPTPCAPPVWLLAVSLLRFVGYLSCLALCCFVELLHPSASNLSLLLTKVALFYKIVIRL